VTVRLVCGVSCMILQDT